MSPLLLAGIVLFFYMTGAFGVALVSKDNGIADIAYGLGFALLAWVTYLVGIHSIGGIIATVLATIWGARLSTRIYLKNRGKPEDFRYKKWREEWGKNFKLRSFFQVFMLQGAIIFIIVLPVTLVNLYGNDSLGLLGFFGIAVWLTGFFFEAVGDYQLDAFLHKPENKGHIMQSGLWRYTRHPNYFGESLMWWGLGVLGFDILSVSWNSLEALVVFLSPALITFLLLKVSGVPLLEAHFSGPEWEAYKAKTNVFIPRFSKRT